MASNWKETANKALAKYEPIKVFIAGAGLVTAIWAAGKFLSSDKDVKQMLFDASGYLMKQARALPVIKEKIQEKHQEITAKIAKQARETDKEPLYDLPEDPMNPKELFAKLEALKNAEEHLWKDGRVSGAVYSGDENLREITTKAYDLFVFCNPLHSDVFPSMRKFEGEIIRFAKKMLHADDKACGAMTSGGTESLLLAVKTCRDYAREKRGITKPEVVLPVTAHAAFDKASGYFGVKLVKIPLGPDFKVDIKKVKESITSNTIMLVGSAPNFPHGIIDDIEALSALAQQFNIPLHVDACLGGYLLPWAKELEYPIPDFDFKIPGVTSMSCDTHKYGFAPKGTSVILFRTHELRHYMYFTVTDWPGGIYASPTMAGSRPGGLIAGCWAALVSTGKKGYRDATNMIMQCQKKLKEGLQGIPDVKLLGDSCSPVLAWTTTTVNIFNVADYMSKKRWHLSVLQKPPSMHISITLRHVGREDALLEDFKDAIKQAKITPEVEGGNAPVYGLASTIPDRSLVSELIWTFLDANLDT